MTLKTEFMNKISECNQSYKHPRQKLEIPINITKKDDTANKTKNKEINKIN